MRNSVILRSKRSIVVILKNHEITISPQRMDEIWIGDASRSSGPRQPIKTQYRYLTNRWTDFDEIWHSQASRFSGLTNIIMTMFGRSLHLLPLVLIVSSDIKMRNTFDHIYRQTHDDSLYCTSTVW